MKPLLFILATFINILFINVGVNAQCCPYIDSVSIYPENPTSIDSVYLVTKVTTPNKGWLMESGFSIDVNNIIFETCYFAGNYAVLTTHDIDFNLGLLPAGEYDLDFIAYNSNIPEYCLKDDTSSISIDFVVSDYLSVERVKKDNGITVSPNPAKNRIMISNLNNQAFQFEIISTNGQIVKSDNNASENVIDISELKAGIYFLNIELEGLQTFKKLIKE